MGDEEGMEQRPGRGIRDLTFCQQILFATKRKGGKSSAPLNPFIRRRLSNILHEVGESGDRDRRDQKYQEEIEEMAVAAARNKNKLVGSQVLELL